MSNDMLSARSALIFFSDIVGGSRLSDILTPQSHVKILSSFHAIASEHLDSFAKNESIPKSVVCDGGIIGDEISLFIILDTMHSDQLQRDLRAVVIAILEAAIRLNVAWFLSSRNLDRIKIRAAPIRLGMGLHFGTVILDNTMKGYWKRKHYPFDWEIAPSENAQGFAINFGKRVETASRLGLTTGIALSQSFLGLCRHYGLPIQVGNPIISETKGFEGREPIYELVGQDIITSYDKFRISTFLSASTTADGMSYRDLLLWAFQRDPEKTLWFLELAVETLLLEGSIKSKSDVHAASEAFALAVQLGERATSVTQSPERLMFRIARCLHRQAYSSPQGSSSINEEDDNLISKAIRYYDQASKHKDLIWAQNDLAAAYWKRASRRERPEERLQDYLCGLKACEVLMSEQPNHFYAYNLWALIASDMLYWIHNPLEPHPDNQRVSDEPFPLLNKAKSYLEIARHIHDKPSYLYYGTEAHIKRAEFCLDRRVEYLDAGLDLLALARKKLQETIGNLRVDQIPRVDFYLTGYAIPGFQPPRVSQLEDTWTCLSDSLIELKKTPMI